MRRALSFLVVLAACTGGDPAKPDAPVATPDAPVTIDATIVDVPEMPADAAVSDAAPLARCPAYPLPWLISPQGTQAAAAADLASISPGATLTWNDPVDTLQSIAGMDAMLPGCADGEDVNAQVMAFLAAHPALFQIDVTEWGVPLPLDCSLITEDVQTFSMGRTRVASHPLNQDLFTYNLKRVGGVVEITGVYAIYLATPYAGVDDQMTACNTLTAEGAASTARSTPLPAVVLDQCVATGNLTYQIHDNDTLTFARAENWGWDASTGQVLLSATRTLRVTVNPLNYTADLLASTARCPVTDPDSEDFTVGFDITFDAFTGEILFILAGLDCVVC
jgi:hypothetical protein